MNWLEPDQIRKTSPTELGEGGLCFLVAEILLERNPEAILYRLTSPAHEYGHVYLLLDDNQIDIKGPRDVVAAMRTQCDDQRLVPEKADTHRVRRHFYPKYSTAQLCAARETFLSFIDSNPQIFKR